MKTTWEEIKGNIRSEIPENPFSLWINPITFLENKDDTVVLGCPNKFSQNWVKENFLDLIRNKFRMAGCDVSLKVSPNKRKDILSEGQWESRQLRLPHMAERSRKGRLRLNTDFTFNRFIVGPCNEFAYSASKALAQGGAWNYHSLMMLSHTGLGKSHLSQAIGHAILGQDEKQRVYYLTAEDFTNEMIAALKTNCIDAFKNRYRRQCDVLILEEIHFLSGKEKTQVELGYTLDALANDNRKVIFTSSLPPQDIPRLSNELSSRLTAGLISSIRRPDYETRVKILTQKAQEQGIELSPDIVHLLASRLKRDIRQMESALKCLKARAEFLDAKIDPEMAKDVLSCLVSTAPSVSLDEIKELVCKYYKIEPEALPGKSRKKIYAYPRNIYVYLCRRHTDETIETIARTINRSHPTIVYASELVERKMKTNSKMRHEVNFLAKKIGDGKSGHQNK
jgi:chromosomal replication initiator protein